MEATAHNPQAWAFIRSKLGSGLAIAPLGVWTFFHVWDNLAAYRGAEAWRDEVTHYGHPISFAVTTAVVLLPLVFHTVWGFQRLATSRPNNARYGYFENLKYLLQRLSAVGVVLFLGAHLWLAFFHPRAVEGHAETFADISQQMHHHLPTLAVYLLGTLGVSYHLGNGVEGFAMGWGLAQSRRSLRMFRTLSFVVFGVLLAMCWGAIYGLWAAGA